MKQVRIDKHKTPQFKNDKDRMNNLVSEVLAHYGDQFKPCGYCGNYRHQDYVCIHCDVDTGYLVDENGELVREDGKLVPVYEVPDKE